MPSTCASRVNVILISLVLAELGNLLRLQVLTLSHNKIQKVPASLSRLQKLFALSLSNNPLEVLPTVNPKQMYWCSAPSRLLPPQQTVGLPHDGLDPRSYPDI